MFNFIKKTLVKNKEIKDDPFLVYYDPLHDEIVLIKRKFSQEFPLYVYEKGDTNKKHLYLLLDAPEFYDFIYIGEFN